MDNWAEQSGLGFVFDSSTGFRLPNQSYRSPVAAWVSNLSWVQLCEQEKEKFPPLCPEFVVELMSESDSLKEAKHKMEEYMQNGCKLGWLISINSEEVFIYRSDGRTEIVKGFTNKISGEPVLPGFEFDLSVLR